MYKILLSYILTILIMLSVIACGNVYYWTKIGENTKMYNEFDKTMTHKQLDSLCVADTLNLNYKTWHNMPYYDGETNEKLVEYVYIKKNNETKETTYILRPVINENNDTTFNITKRITIKQNITK